MSTRLPVELLQQIVDYIDDKSSLENLFVVTKPLIKTLIAPILYKKIEVVMMMMDVEFFGKDVRNIRQRIIEHDGWVAPYVECLSIFPEPGSAADEEMQLYVDQVLPLLVNLKRFRLVQYGGSTGAQFSRIAKRLAHSPFPFSLTHLIWDADISDTSAFAEFLATQPQLVHMEVESDTPALHLLPDAVQHLSVLRGGPDLVFDILLGRHISHVRIDSFGLQPAPVDPVLEHAFHHVQSLQCSGRLLHDPHEIARHFINLEFLRLHDTYLASIVDYIGLLSTTKLRYLQIFSSEEFSSECPFIPDVFSNLRSLEVIDFRTDPAKDVFARFCRDVSDHTAIQINASTWEPWWHGCKLTAPGRAEV